MTDKVSSGTLSLYSLTRAFSLPLVCGSLSVHDGLLAVREQATKTEDSALLQS